MNTGIGTIIGCCIVALIFVQMVQAAQQGANNFNAKYDRSWKKKKADCERYTCSQYLPDEGMNCVNECTSQPCYQEVYAYEPLEDGEVDVKRAKQFTNCLRKDARQQEVSYSSRSYSVLSKPYL